MKGFDAATERYQQLIGCRNNTLISRYREFIESVWLPYAQQHETICAAVAEELTNHSPQDEVIST